MRIKPVIIMAILTFILTACSQKPDLEKSMLFKQCDYVWTENSEALQDRYMRLQMQVDNMGRKDMELVDKGKSIMMEWQGLDKKMTALQVYEDYYRADDDIDPHEILSIEFGFEYTTPENVINYFINANDSLKMMIKKMNQLENEALR